LKENHTTMSDKHANSRKVTIFRAGSFLENAQKEAQEFMSMSKQSIGSYFSGTLGSSVGNGLSFAEIDVLMPLLIDIPKDDRTFREGVTTFFKQLLTTIPYGTGRELEIGLELDNSKPVTYVDSNGTRNLPIKIQDYIRYRHAVGHPWVAGSKAEAQGNMLKIFYIFDPEAVSAQTAAIGKTYDEAMATYLGLKNDLEKVDAMLTMMDVDIRKFLIIESLDERADAKMGELREKVQGDPAKFLEQYKGDHFEYRFQVLKMINTGVIRKIGSQLVDNETGGILGHNMEEVIYYLKDVNNSEKVAILKAKTQEAMKKKINIAKAKPRVATTR